MPMAKKARNTTQKFENTMDATPMLHRLPNFLACNPYNFLLVVIFTSLNNMLSTICLFSDRQQGHLAWLIWVALVTNKI
jgi:hypothetical protein